LFPEWTWIVGLVIGAAIGSFLNVVIYRMPRAMSLSNPPNSFCPKCKHRLLMSDMIPLVTWLIQRGRCKYCDARIPSRYFWVELLNGAIWAGIWWQYLIATGDPAKAICYALAASTLVAIIFIDWELYIIPDQINAFLFFVGIGYNVWLIFQGSPAAWTWGIPSSVAGALVGVGVLWGIAFLGRVLFRKDAMGHGDIKMARGIGAILFPMLAAVSFGLAVFLGAVIGGLLVLISRQQGKFDVENDSVLVPKVATDAVRKLVQSHRQAKPADLGSITSNLLMAIRTDMLGSGRKGKGSAKGWDEVVSRLEQSPNTWLATQDDQTEVHLSQRFLEVHGQELDLLDKAVLDRKWEEAEQICDQWIKTGKISLQEHLQRLKRQMAGKSRFMLFSVEPIPTLVKCGVGYFLCFDVIGLFIPKFYISWFDEDPFEPVVLVHPPATDQDGSKEVGSQTEDELADGWRAGLAHIPFGPYIAVGAILAIIFETALLNGIHAYLQSVIGSESGF